MLSSDNMENLPAWHASEHTQKTKSEHVMSDKDFRFYTYQKYYFYKYIQNYMHFQGM